MKKALLIFTAVASAQSYAMCTAELQYQGSVLGRNVFTAYECRDALRECKMAQKTYERENKLSELECVSYNDSNPNPPTNPYPPTNPNPNPYPPTNPNPYPNPGQNYSRLEALRAIEAAENSAQDADMNLNLVLDEVSRNVGSLYELTNVFVKLLQLNGGANSTSETQVMFKRFADIAFLNHMPMTEVSDAYELVSRAENGNSDSQKAVELSLNLSISHGISLYEAATAYVDILRAEGGANSTSDTVTTITYLTNLTQREKRSAIQFYLDIRVLENGSADARNLLNLVFNAIDKGIRASEAQGSMVSLLRQYGANETSTIINKYRNMFRI